MTVLFQTSWFQSSSLATWSNVRALFATATCIFVFSIIPFPAHGADLCISIAVNPPASLTIVGQGFEIPPAGACRSFQGFLLAASGASLPNTATGTGCTASDGTHIALGLIIMTPDTGTIGFSSILLPLPSLTGGTAKNSSNDNATPIAFPASGGVCGGIPVP